MAYIKKEEVKNIREMLKKEFPNIKFSVTTVNYSKVSISILSSNIDFFSDYKREIEKYENEREYMQVNIYYIDTSFTGESKKILTKINEIAHSQNWFDNSDAMTDYFHTAYYVSISIGKWDRPYKLIESKRAA